MIAILRPARAPSKSLSASIGVCNARELRVYLEGKQELFSRIHFHLCMTTTMMTLFSIQL
ncbi:mCG148348 [Mus musculus]|nr:mCG148348 [Mus musculus]